LSITGSGIDSIDDIFVSSNSWCVTDNIEPPLSLSGTTSCDTFAAIRACEAQYYIDRCGEAQEHQYIDSDPLERGYYAQCKSGDATHCWPISHWKCPSCPQCQNNDPNFIGCLSDTDENRQRFGSKNCSFVGSLDGTTPCSTFDELKSCLEQQCLTNCSSCVDKYTGFYALCDDGGVPSCRPQGQWLCENCSEIDPKTGCKGGSGKFNPSHIDIPLSVVGGGGNPSAMVVRIPINPTNPMTNNEFSDGNIRIPSGINELTAPGANYNIISINGEAPYTTGFEIKNIKVTFDNLTGKTGVKFDASIFYCESGYNRNNNIYLCPPQNFNSEKDNDGCQECNQMNIIQA
jgi:hypothetical protein